MFKVSKLADYAMIVVVNFICNPEKLYSASELVSLTGLNLPTLRKILNLLSIGGVLSAKRGIEGGYVLAMDVAAVSVLDVIEAIDGKFACTECCLTEFESCRVNCCKMRDYWNIINHKLHQTLSEFIIQDLITKINSKEIMSYER